MDQAYAQASSQSYDGQKKTLLVAVGNHPVEIPLGFQPLGISRSGDRIAIADYFGPAAVLAKVSLSGRTLEFADINWIRGTMVGEESVRMFPGVFKPGGANRLQNVLVLSESLLGLTRSGDRRIFLIRRMGDGKWHHDGEYVLPGGPYPLLHSTVFEGQKIITMESDGSLKHWARCEYRVGESIVASAEPVPVTPYRYLGDRSSDGILYSVGDIRAGRPEGVYADAMPVYGGGGNGIVLLGGGKDGALMTRYGQAYPGPFNGIPGALIYLPPRYLTP